VRGRQLKARIGSQMKNLVVGLLRGGGGGIREVRIELEDGGSWGRGGTREGGIM
jgi:hypothetical protein